MTRNMPGLFRALAIQNCRNPFLLNRMDSSILFLIFKQPPHTEKSLSGSRRKIRKGTRNRGVERKREERKKKTYNAYTYKHLGLPFVKNIYSQGASDS